MYGSNEPCWNQSFVYNSLRRADLKSRLLEVRIFHLDERTTELMGCVLIELSTVPLDNEPEWYLLENYEETMTQLVRHLFDLKVN